LTIGDESSLNPGSPGRNGVFTGICEKQVGLTVYCL
jgi:hypothetical protein